MILGARTKKVTTYGRRNTRIINVHADLSPDTDWEPVGPSAPSATPSKPAKVLDLGSARPVKIGNVNGIKTSNKAYDFDSPLLSPAPKPNAKESKRPARRPLQSKASQDVVRPLNLTPAASPDKKKPAPRHSKATLRTKLGPISVSSSDDEPVLRRHVVPKRRALIPRSPSASVSPRLSPLFSSVQRNRRVTGPMRGSAGSVGNDLAERLAKVAVRDASPEDIKDVQVEVEVVSPVLDILPLEMIATTPTKSHDPLEDLLAICSYNEPVPIDSIFTLPAFVACLPGHLRRGAKPIIHKIGEASYSEVFSVKASENDTEVVVKIIPLLQGAPRESTPSNDDEDEIPDCSEIPEVVREIKLTRHMGHVPGGGFIDFLGAFVVEGAYTSDMLDEWDRYDKENGSQSVRPVNFTSLQQYAFLVLCDGGDDLETYRFEHSKGWVQAAAVFWQVADALARAEEWTKFEHRDLHEGQILVAPVETPSVSPVANYLDPNETAVRTSIIDFGLSRLNLAGNPVAGRLPVECYDGNGAQWDVYRAMRDLIEVDDDPDAWDGFYPRTNVMWLQYIIRRLLHNTKTLRKPIARKGRGTAARKPRPDSVKERSDAAYAMLALVETELAAERGRRGKRGFASAGEVMVWGRFKGWVQ